MNLEEECKYNKCMNELHYFNDGLMQLEAISINTSEYQTENLLHYTILKNPTKQEDNQVKLIIAIVQDNDSNQLMNAFRNANIQSTKLASTGGFLKEGNTTLMIGSKEENVSEVLNTIQYHCSQRSRVIAPDYPMRAQVHPKDQKPVKVEVGGAIVFVLPIEAFNRF